jgi:hypothetical protein
MSQGPHALTYRVEVAGPRENGLAIGITVGERQEMAPLAVARWLVFIDG